MPLNIKKDHKTEAKTGRFLDDNKKNMKTSKTHLLKKIILETKERVFSNSWKNLHVQGHCVLGETKGLNNSCVCVCVYKYVCVL